MLIWLNFSLMMLSIIMISLWFPLFSLVVLIFISILIGVKLKILAFLSFISMMLLLMMVSGLLIIFSYITSLSSNELFFNSTSIPISQLLISLNIFLFLFILAQLFYPPQLMNSIEKLIQFSQNFYILFLSAYLMIFLTTSVYLASTENSAMKIY